MVCVINITRETFHWSDSSRAIVAACAGREHDRSAIESRRPESISDCYARLAELGYIVEQESDRIQPAYVATDDGLAAAGLEEYRDVLMIDTDGGCHVVPYEAVRRCDPTDERYQRLHIPEDAAPGDMPHYYVDTFERSVDIMLTADCRDPIRTIGGLHGADWVVACDGTLWALSIANYDTSDTPRLDPIPWPPEWYTPESAVHHGAPGARDQDEDEDIDLVGEDIPC